MTHWLQWLNDNWFAIAAPILIVLIFWLGGLWLRRISYDAFGKWVAKAKWKARRTVVETTRSHFLHWCLLLGFHIAIQISIMPSTAKVIGAKIIVSLFIFSLTWLTVSLSEKIFMLYLPELRLYLAKIKAPQPATPLLVNIIRTLIVVIGLVILLGIWRAPDISGILILAAGLFVVTLALRDAITDVSRKVHLSPSFRSLIKLLLILLVIASLVEVTRRGYFLFTGQADPTSGIMILLLEIGFLIWLVSVLRGFKYRRVKPSFKLVFFSLLGIALLCAFAGVQPLTTYKDSMSAYIKDAYKSISIPKLTIPAGRSSWADAVAVVEPAVVRIETKDVQGSGIIIDKEGLVLTNNHVTKGAQSVTVTLPTGAQYRGEVVGRDEAKDLAMIRIASKYLELRVATLGNSATLQKGDEVAAIGYPLGLRGSPTVSKGIVSAMRQDSKTGVTYIQTDAPVNPGGSGGPLINLKGQVIGIVTAKIVHEKVEAIGFAIAIDDAKPFISKVTEKQRVQRQIEDMESKLEALEYEVLAIVNSERLSRNIAPLKWDDKLHGIARKHSQEMARRGELFHSSIYESYAENAWGGSGYWDASTIVNSWMGSLRHRTWLLSPNLKHVGVGIAVSDKGMYASWTFWRSETTSSDWWYVHGSPPPDWMR